MVEITDFRKDKYHFEEVFCTHREGYMVSKSEFTAYFDDTLVTYRIVLHCYMVEGDDNHVFTDFYAVPSFGFWDIDGFLEMSLFAFVLHDISQTDFSDKTDKIDYYWLPIEKNDDRVIHLSSNVHTADLSDKCEKPLLNNNYIFGLLNYYVNHVVDLDELTSLCNSNCYKNSFYYNVKRGNLRDLGSLLRKIANHISSAREEI